MKKSNESNKTKDAKLKGFTLVELIVVIAIIGVLASVLVPTMMGRVKQSRLAAANDAAAKIAKETATLIVDMEMEGIITNDGCFSAGKFDSYKGDNAASDAIMGELPKLVPALKDGHYAIYIEHNAVAAVAFSKKEGDKYIGSYPVQAKGPIMGIAPSEGEDLECYLGNAAGQGDVIDSSPNFTNVDYIPAS